MKRKVGQNEVKIGFALACNWYNTLFNVKLKNQINLIGQQPQPHKTHDNPNNTTFCHFDVRILNFKVASSQH